MTTLQERIAKAREHVKLYGDRPTSLWAYQDFAINVGELFNAIEEQTRTIGALNQCLGGKDSTSLENITRIGELESQLSKWETTLTAVMPADFKDWHQNSKAEWPEIAALVITNLREHIDEDAAYVARLEEQVAALKLDAGRLDALSTPGWELSINDDCECADDELWVVHLCSGGRNDREWRLIGSGATPRAAIDKAINAQKGTP